jgi:autotransporter-associated beta strand protein
MAAGPTRSSNRLFPSRSLAVCALGAAVALLAPSTAGAQLVTWNVTTGTWSDGGSWLGGATPATTGTAVFSGTSVGSQNVAALLSGATTIGGLSFNNTGTASLRSDSATTQTLTLGTGGITMSATAGPVTIGASGSAVNILLGGTQTWTNNSTTRLLSILGTIDTDTGVNAGLTINTAGTTSLAGSILGDTGRVISLTKSGSGALVLSGSNSYSGGTTLSAGRLDVNNAWALGTGTLTVSASAALGNSSGTAVTLATNNPVVFSGSFSYAGPNDLNLGTGAVTFSGTTAATATANVSFGTLTLGGVVTTSTAGLTKSGAGTLVLAGNNGSLTAPLTASAGILRMGHASGLGTGTTTVSSGATLDLNGFSTGVPLSLSGSGLSGVYQTNTLGALVNTSTTSASTVSGSVTLAAATAIGGAGTITLSGPVSGAFGLSKVGSGRLNVTGSAAYAGTTTVNSGSLVVSGSGVLWSQTGITVNPGATFVFDNSAGVAATNRSGTAASRPITLNGGGLRLVGNASTTVSETVSALTPGSGGNVITFDAAGTQGIGLVAGGISTPGGFTSTLIRGIDGTAVPGVGVLTSTSSITSYQHGHIMPTGTFGSKDMAVRPDIIVDPSPTGVGAGFAVRDPATGRVRAVAAAELESSLAVTFSSAAVPTGNYGLSTTQAPNGGSQTIYSLTLNAGGGVAGTPGSQLTVTSGGFLAFPGNTGMSVDRIGTYGSYPAIFHTVGSGTLELNGSLVNSGLSNVAYYANGLVKAGDGTLVFNRRQYYTDTAGSTTINGGTLRLNAGDNTILVRATGTVPTPIALYANGGTFDLNGATQLVERVQSVGTLPGTGGAITGAAGSRLVSVTGGSGTFAGTIMGPVEFQKAGSGTTTLTSGQDTTGAVIVRGGGLTLRDSGVFSAVPSVTVNQATLTLDDTGLSANSARLGSAPVTLNGGQISFLGRQGTQPTYTLPSLSLAGGQSLLTLTPTGGTAAGSAVDVVVSSLSRTASSVLIVDAMGGSLGQAGANPRLTLTSATNTNSILGGWATIVDRSTTAAGMQWATVDSQGRVGALGSAGFAAYSANSITGTTNNASMNIKLETNAVGIPTQTINSLRFGVGNYTASLGVSGTAARLTLASGGLMFFGQAATGTISDGAGGGSALTSGTDNLFVLVDRGDQDFTWRPFLNIRVSITDNPANPSAPVGLVKNGVGGLTLSSTGNTYTGTTVVNAGALTLNSAAGGVMVPGNLVIAGNGASVTMSGLAGQIATTSTVSINGGGTLTLTGTNTLASLSFDNIGGATTPTVNAAARLILSASSAITAANDNPATTPTISGTSLAFLSTTPTITTSGLSPLDLLISATIASAGGPITKTGAGSLVLSASNTFSTGVNLSAGSIFVDNNAALGTGTLTFSGGTNLQSLSAVRTIANNVAVAGDFSLGGTQNTNDIVLSGTMDLGGSQRTVTVADIVSTGSITGVVTGAGGLTKAGMGTLVLAGTSTFGGPLAINQGTLVTGSINSGGVAGPLGMSSAAAENLVLGGGRLQYTGATGTTNRGFTLTNSTTSSIDVSTAATDLTFTGSIAASTGALAKMGPGTLTLAGGGGYSGGTWLSAGRLNINSPTAIGTGPLTVAASGTLGNTSGTAIALTTNIPITFSGAFEFAGPANLNMGTGAVSFLGATPAATTATVSSGTFALGGPITTSTAGLTKAGASTLVLAGSSSYTGPTTLSAGQLNLHNAYAIGTGTLTVGAGLTLGNSSGGSVTLATNNPVVFSGGFSYAGPSNLNLGTGAVTLSGTPTATVNFGTLTLGGAITTSTVGISKAGAGTLVLSGSNSFAGNVGVTAGILRMGHASALGTGTTTVSSGATLDVNGFSRTLPLTVSGTGLSGNYQQNTLGSIINSSTTSASTISGSVTFGAATAIGNAGLGWTRPNAAAATIPTAGAGDLTLSGPVSGAFAFTKVGDNRLFITGSAAYAGTTTVNAGTLVLSGSAGGGGVLWNQTGITVNPNASLVFDNSASFAAASRTGTVSARPIMLNAGTLNLFGNASVSGTESLGTGALTANSGFNVITISGSAGTGLVLSANTFGNANAGTVLVRGNNLGAGAPAAGRANLMLTSAPTTTGQAGGDGTLTKAIVPWAIVDQSAVGSGTSFLAYSATGGVRPLASTEYQQLTTMTSATNNNNWYLASAVLSGTAGQNVNPNSLTLQGSGSLTLGANSVFQPQAGILAYGANNVIGGGQGFVGGPSAQNLFLAVAGSTSRLTISSPLGYTGAAVANAINKFGDGELVLSAKGFLPRPVYLNSGTLTLAGGTNTLAFAVATPPSAFGGVDGRTQQYTRMPSSASALYVSTGGVLDLNGNDQGFGGLFGNAGSSALPGSGGVVTNSSATAATLTIVNYTSSAATTTFAGSITGNLNFTQTGVGLQAMTGPNSYSGTTVIAGQGFTLQDLGTLENTSRVTIIGVPLIWNDTGLAAVANRLPAAAPIDLLGGSLSWSSRAGLTSAISTGTVTPVRGNSILNVTVGSGGAATMTIAGLGSRSTGATLTFAGSGTFGSGGSNPSVLFTANPTLASGIIGGWALTNGANSTGVNGAFVTYDPVFGIRPLSSYATTVGAMASGSNARLGAATFSSGTTVANSLTVNGATLSFTNPSDLVNLESGGILFQAASTLGGSAGSGLITAGGLTATSGTRELFVHALAASTINSSVVDNPAGAKVALVLGGQGGNTLTLTGSNTHSAGTYVNTATVVLSSTAGFAVPGDLFATGGSRATSLAATGNNFTGATTVRWAGSNQMAPTGAITIRAAMVNLNGFSNSVAGLTFVNDSMLVGTLSDDTAQWGVPPSAILTDTGTLTLTGPIAVPNPIQAAIIPVIAGNLDLGGGSRTLTVDPVAAAPNQIGLAITAGMRNGSLVSTGSGVVFLGGVSGSVSYTGNAGTLVLGNTGFLGGRVTLGSAATLDMRGGSFTIGSLAGSGTVTNNTTSTAANTAGTLTFGVDNTSTTFSGVITNFANTLPGTLTGMPLHLTKIGTGTTTFTGNVATVDTGTFTVSQGGVVFSGPTTTAFNNAVTVNAGGTLVLDNASTAVNNRLGGPTLLNAATARGAVTLNGGGLRLVGNASTTVSETVSTLTPGAGGSVITFDAAGTQGIALVTGSISSPGGFTSTLIRGIDGTAVPGVGVLTSTSSITSYQHVDITPTGAFGSKDMAVRPDIIVDPSPTGVGAGFAVRDPATGRVRAVAAAELESSLAVTYKSAFHSTGNYGLSTTQAPNGGSQTIYSLTLNAGGGVAGTPGSQLAVTSAGFLAFPGNTGISVDRIGGGNVAPVFFHTVGSGTLALNGSLASGVISSNFMSSGLVKAGDGTLLLNRRQYYTDTVGSNGTTINGGTLRLNAGDNTILVRATAAAATPTLIGLYANGGTFDMNGATQLVERVQSVGTLPGTGGTITGAAGSRLVSVTGASGTFAGSITGAVEFQKGGSGVLTMVSGNDTTGAVIVRGGGLTLRDSGSFSAAASVTVNQATLTLEDTGLSANSSRLGTSPITLAGAALTFLGRQSAQPTYTLPSLTLADGQSTITLLPAAVLRNSFGNSNPYGSSVDAAVSSFSRASSASVLDVAVNDPLHVVSGTNARLTLNGATNTNDILGGWATMNGNSGWASVNAQGVVGALGSTGYPAYSANNLLSAGNNATMNINAGAGTVSNIPTQTINSLRIGMTTNGVATMSLGQSGSGATLRLASGGMLLNVYGGNATFVDASGGSSALTSGTDILFLHVYNSGNAGVMSNLTLGVRITNNGGSPIGLVKSGGGTVLLSSTWANTYTGTTVVNSGPLVLNSPTGAVMIPGDLVIATSQTPGSSVGISSYTASVSSTTSAGQIASTSNVTIRGGGSLTLTGTNTLASLSFDNIGGATTPTVNAAARLILSASSAITAANDNPATTPTISGTSLAFTSTTPTITTSGLSPLDLLISATIASAGGPITKTGAGSLVLTASNTFTTGVNLSAGSIFVDHSAALGTGTLTFSGGGNLQSLSAVRTIANNVAAAGDFSLGGTQNTNDIVLSGTVALGGSQRTITVADIVSTGSITGVVTGAGGITKAGMGTLALSGSNAFSGGVSLTAGQLLLGNDAALGTGTFAISGGWFNVTAARLTTNNNPQAWNGDLTFLGSNTLNLGTGTVTLGTSPTVNVVASTLTVGGPIVGNGMGFTKAGAGTLVLSGSSSYTGPTTINAGQITASHAFALGDGSGALTVDGGVLGIGSGINIVRSGSITLVGGTISTGTLTMNGSVIDARSGLISTNLAGAAGLRKTTSGTVTLSGSNTYAGTTRVEAGRLDVTFAAGLYGGGTASWTAANIMVAGNANLSLRVAGGGFSAANLTTLLTNLGATGNAVNVDAGFQAGSVLGIDTQNGNFTLADNLRDSTGAGGGTISLAKYGANTLTMTGTSTYTGTTTIAAGSLQLGTAGQLGATGTFAGPIVMVGSLEHASSRNQTLSGTLSGAGGVTKVSGAGVLTLTGSNTYTGKTTISSGTLAVSWLASAGQPSPLGAATGANATIDIGSGANAGAFRYVGTGTATTDRLFNLAGTTGGAVLDASGAGPLVLGGGFTYNATGNKTLTLTGSSTAANSIGALANPSASATTSLVKTGSGRWTLTAASTFTGSTAILDGTMVVATNAPQDGNGAFGYSLNGGLGGGSSPVVELGDGAAGVSGTAGMLLDQGAQVGRLVMIPELGVGGSQKVAIGGANTTGTTRFQSAMTFFVNRDVTLQSAAGGTVDLANGWARGSVGAGEPVANSFTVGTAGNTGIVLLSGNLSTSGSVVVRHGMLHARSVLAAELGVTVDGSTAELKYNGIVPLESPLYLVRGVLSGTGVIAALGGVTAGTDAILSPGNSPGIQPYTTGLTWAEGGTYLWEVNNWTGGTAGTDYDQIQVSGGPLDITASSGSTFRIAITSLTASNTAGLVPNFDPNSSRTFTIATSDSGLTGFDATKFSLDTAGFANSLTNGDFWIAADSSNVFLNYTPFATYTLSASAASGTMIVGGTTTIEGVVTNTGTAGADTIDYSSFAVASLSGTLSLSPSSGIALANETSGTGTADFTPATAGSYTFTPQGTFTNTNLGTPAIATGTTTTTVTVLEHSNAVLSLVSGGGQTIITGGTFAPVVFELTNAGANRSPLDVANLVNLSGSTGSALVASGGTASYEGTAFDAVTVAAGTLSVSLDAGDDQSLPGAFALQTLTGSTTYTVLEHSYASFTSGTDAGVLTLDFGIFDTVHGNIWWPDGNAGNPINFSLWNFATNGNDALTAGLALTATGSSGDTAGFELGITELFANLQSGSSNGYTALFNPNLSSLVTGTQSATFTLSFADQSDLSGAIAGRSLTINMNVVIVPEPTTMAMGAIGAAMAGYSYWRRRRRAERV